MITCCIGISATWCVVGNSIVPLRLKVFKPAAQYSAQFNIHARFVDINFMTFSGRLAPTDVHVASPQRRVPPER